MSRWDDGRRGSPGFRRPVVRLGAIGEAWRFFLARWGTWVLAGLVVLLANAALGTAVSAVFGRRLPLGRGFRLEVPPAQGVVEGVLTAVLNGYFLGGLFRMACRQVRGERFGVTDLSGITDVLTELSIGLAIFAGGCCLLAPFGLIPAFILAGVWMFMIPLIVDARLPALVALRESWRALKGEWIAATLFQFVVYALAGVGTCCCVGLLFTWPLYALSIAVLYRDAFILPPPSPVPASKPFPHDPDF